ncbi:MAG: glucodextranase DOMON-like domain-containing protein [Candidatus Omnitrophica bacterium]|nr:glucodextranase DOMON-like domain-containing protein [Candidatus Omnitrophota bacterium]MDD5737980.1 glucodextranase DOMON-like domain-containing protein [Candidatus Omnitrophota bacterium]
MKRVLVVLVAALAFCPFWTAANAEDVAVNGHKIAVDKAIRDWKGAAPEAENTAAVSEGEYIWKDAAGDDAGNGKYVYPQNKALKKGGDLKEFRVTFDSENLYFMIKTDRPGDWWVPYRIIGIDTDGASGGKNGSQVLAQGDMDEYAFDSGCFAELKVSPELACDYVVAVSSTYKGRIWDAKGKMIARKEAQPDDTAGFKIEDYNWNAVEVAIPWSLVGGKPAEGTSWRFVVAIGQQDNDLAREVEEEVSEYRAGGGESSEDNGVDPDVFDLAGADKATQEKELGSYKADGEPGDTGSFATIDKSFLTVKFGK